MTALTRLRRATAAITLAALAACSGGGGSQSIAPTAHAPTSTLPTSSSPTSASSGRMVTLLKPTTAFTSAVTLIGAATSVSSVALHVIPALQNAAGLEQYAQQVATPGSGVYRQFMTASQIGNRYGATAADYSTVANYFASYGLKVGGWPQRLALTVAGPRAAMERALGTSLAFYKTKSGHTVLAPMGNVQFAKALPVAMIPDAVFDPSNHFTDDVKASAPSLANINGSTPQQIAAALDFDSAYSAGFTGAGITIGIIGTGPAMETDLATFKAVYGVQGASALKFPPVNANSAANAGGSPTASPPPVTGPCNASSNPFVPSSDSPAPGCNPEDIEAQIDTEQAGSLARDSTIDFYLAYVPVECDTPGSATCAPGSGASGGLGYAYQGLDEADDEIQQIIADDSVDIVSGSFGGPEILNLGYDSNDLGGYDPSALLPSEMAALAVEGIATFFSSGDDGAETCAPYSLDFAAASLQCATDPASDSNVTAVGGVTLPVTNAGTLAGPITAWGLQTGTGGASGGGVSCIYPAPPWEVQPGYQTTAGSPSLLTSAGSSGCAASGLSGGGRVVPDISMIGDPETGVPVVANVAFGQQNAIYGGTSVAAPQMAAMWALVLNACAKTPSCATATGAQPYRLGNAAPLLWKTYQSQTAYSTTIYDVTFGNNAIPVCEYLTQAPATPCTQPNPVATGYLAGTGWDADTGLGVPFARHLITAIVGI